MTMDQGRKKLLIAVDGSDQAMKAVAYTSRMVPADSSEVTLFHVDPQIPESLWDMEQTPEWRTKLAPLRAWEIQQTRNMADFMESGKKLFLEAGFPEDAITLKARPKKVGIARDIIAEFAKGYDAIVVGRIGVSAVQEILMGGTANKLINNIHHAPVVLVGGEPSTDRVLMGFDGSEGSLKAVRRVGSLLGAGTKEVVICNVIRGLNIIYGRYGFIFDDVKESEWISDHKSWIAPKITMAEESLYEIGYSKEKVSHMYLTDASSRAASLVEEARRAGFGSIVMGRRGLSIVEEFIMGRVSKKVVQLATDRAVWVMS